MKDWSINKINESFEGRVVQVATKIELKAQRISKHINLYIGISVV